MSRFLPSIWRGDFACGGQWQMHYEKIQETCGITDSIDDRMLISRHPFTTKSWCVVCESVKPMSFSWIHVGTNGAGSAHPAWTEIGVCPWCGLASRQRAIMAYIFDQLSLSASSRIYVAERVTPSYEILKTRFPQTTGSEYLGANFTPGQKRLWMKGNFMVRHEDITNLSFGTNTFDLVLTQDVFEHIPNFVDAFAECNRVLIPGGRLVFSIPFFPHSGKTVIRAELKNGDVIHLMEPEWHGNPVGDGSLCFQHFGWDILDYLKGAGFSEASASWYWGPWQGHIGVPFFVFSATASG